MLSVKELSSYALDFAFNQKVEIPFDTCKICLDKDIIILDKDGEKTEHNLLSEVDDKDVAYLIDLVYATSGRLIYYAKNLQDHTLNLVPIKDAAYGIMTTIIFDDMIEQKNF